jgi:hypothetical protein
MMAKVRAVYPQIESTSDLKGTTVAKLMRHDNVKILGRELDFRDKDPKRLSSKIKQFLISSTSSGKFAPWPLVRVAQIYVKSDILKHGLVLVDIPGSMDANAARSSLAESYRNELSVNLILAPSRRAASDQEALSNLNRTYRRNLQLDGQWNSDSIVFVVVRTDESIDVDDHLEKYPSVLESLSDALEKEKSHNEEKSAVRKERDAIQASYAEKCKATKNLTFEIKTLWKWLRSIPQVEGISSKIRKGGGSRLARAGKFYSTPHYI